MAAAPRVRVGPVVAVALLGMLLPVAVLGGLIWQDPFVREVAVAHGVPVAPDVPGPAAETLARAQRPAADAEAVPVRVEVVDSRGDPVPEVEVALASSRDGESVWRPIGTTDGDGVVEGAAAGAWVLVQLSRGGVVERRSGGHLLPEDGLTLLLMVEARCPGPVRFEIREPPADGWLELADVPGRLPLVPGEEQWLEERFCGLNLVSVYTATDSRRARRIHASQPFAVVDDELVVVDFDEPWRGPSPPRQDFSLTVQCTDCPELVEPCEGEGTPTAGGRTWTCTCRAPCEVVGKWPESLFDWRYIDRPLAGVEPGETDVFVELPPATGDVVGRWTGPVPCAVRGVDRRRGVEVWGTCLADGSFFVSDLFEGPWSVEVGWAADPETYTDRVGREWAAEVGLTGFEEGWTWDLYATRDVTVAGEVDLGALGPD